jgi:hypothetical protein
MPYDLFVHQSLLITVRYLSNEVGQLTFVEYHDKSVTNGFHLTREYQRFDIFLDICVPVRLFVIVLVRILLFDYYVSLL